MPQCVGVEHAGEERRAQVLRRNERDAKSGGDGRVARVQAREDHLLAAASKLSEDVMRDPDAVASRACVRLQGHRGEARGEGCSKRGVMGSGCAGRAS